MKTPGPDHPITIAPLAGRVTVQFKGVRVAQSDKALELKEAQYPAVIYVPRSDISMEHYEITDHRTHCPYKGDASYFSLEPMASPLKMPSGATSSPSLRSPRSPGTSRSTQTR